MYVTTDETNRVILPRSKQVIERHVLRILFCHGRWTFGARGVPGVMHVIEILGVQQARKWGYCMLNDFGGFLDLTFEGWNLDKDVAAATRKPYRNRELRAVSEESKQVIDGTGLCPYVSFSFLRSHDLKGSL